jgi:plasmid stabilization system protein ParE
MGRKKKSTNATRKVRVLGQAFKDIEQIIAFIAVANTQPLNAIKVSDLIFKTIDRISATPFAFKECAQLRTQAKAY